MGISGFYQKEVIMSDKFLAVAQKIAAYPELIANTADSSDNDEYYFVYKGVVMSILQRDESNDWGRYSMYIYPKASTINEVLRAYANGQDEHISIASLHSSFNKETNQTLSKLYNIVKNKDTGLDDLFEKLLS